MTPQQQEEQKLAGSIHESIREVYQKYMTIFDWDIPENNEQIASERILSAMQEGIDLLKEKNRA